MDDRVPKQKDGLQEMLLIPTPQMNSHSSALHRMAKVRMWYLQLRRRQIISRWSSRSHRTGCADRRGYIGVRQNRLRLDRLRSTVWNALHQRVFISWRSSSFMLASDLLLLQTFPHRAFQGLGPDTCTLPSCLCDIGCLDHSNAQ
jgi:hypothetical protein